MADFDPSDHTAPTTLPAAPLSAEEIAKARGWLRHMERGDHLAGMSCARLEAFAPRLLDALEALTAENARLRKAGIAATEAGMRQMERVEDLLSERDRLKAEVERMNQIERAAAEYVETAVALTRPHTDMERTRAAFRNQPAAIQRLIAAVEGYADRDWYASHRRRVEAAHAAAKEAKREAALQELADLGQALQPECYAPGIDMALLGKLCREEPDADAKREVAAMMDGLKAMDAKDGD